MVEDWQVFVEEDSRNVVGEKPLSMFAHKDEIHLIIVCGKYHERRCGCSDAYSRARRHRT